MYIWVGLLDYVNLWLLRCFAFLFVPWYFLEKTGMEVSQIQFNFWIFFSNAIYALALNFSIFLVIGRTGAVTIRVAGVLKDWIIIALSTVIFPESAISGLNVIGYAIALCGLVMYNYIKVKDVKVDQVLPEGRASSVTSDVNKNEESPLMASSRMSYIGRSQLSSRDGES